MPVHVSADCGYPARHVDGSYRDYVDYRGRGDGTEKKTEKRKIAIANGDENDNMSYVTIILS